MSNQLVNLVLEDKTVVDIIGLATGQKLEHLLYSSVTVNVASRRGEHIVSCYLVVSEGEGPEKRRRLYIGKPEALREVAVTESDDGGLQYFEESREFRLMDLEGEYPTLRKSGRKSERKNSHSTLYGLDRLNVNLAEGKNYGGQNTMADSIELRIVKEEGEREAIEVSGLDANYYVFAIGRMIELGSDSDTIYVAAHRNPSLEPSVKEPHRMKASLEKPEYILLLGRQVYGQPITTLQVVPAGVNYDIASGRAVYTFRDLGQEAIEVETLSVPDISGKPIYLFSTPKDNRGRASAAELEVLLGGFRTVASQEGLGR